MAKQRQVDRLDEIIQELREEFGIWRATDEQLLKEVEEAMKRNEETKKLSVEEWASRLAEDLGKFTD